MTEINLNQSPTVNAIFKKREEKQGDSRRPHLGGSLIGRDCDRQLWYIFRWCLTVMHEGRILRLFERGHNEENIFIKELKSIGVTVHDFDPRTGSQFTISDCNGHFGGSVDSILTGLIEAPKTPHVGEYKTHSEKSFKDVSSKGVEKSKPEHYAQMQVYMRKLDLKRAYYLAVNKNNDDLYQERIRIDAKFADNLIAKADRIIFSKNPPPTNRTPDFYKCKWCEFYKVCHFKKMPDRNCRTCVYSSPVDDGQWHCQRHNKIIPLKNQKQHHPCHRFIPSLVPMKQTEMIGDDIIYEGWTDNGK